MNDVAQKSQEDYENENGYGLFFGATTIAAIVGAVAWAGIAAATGYSIGWLAIGLGWLIGMAAAMFGKGDGICQAYSCLVAFLSVAAGTYLGGVALGSQELQVGFFDLLAEVGFSMDLMSELSSPMDLLFYGLAMYQAYGMSGAE